ncbi:MAG: tetratricopeptide repeat protein [Candidatus Sabulitectum sp.]|nr:tetratricopeptide repeat protein [Candidatus Sabulitectum sp.]
MAHRTRKKLTKKEIERDPVGEKLEIAVLFLQTHYKEVIGGLAAILVIVLVLQYMSGRKTSVSEEAMAGFITSSQIYDQAMTAAASNQAQQAFQALDAAYAMSMQTWSNNPQNDWARKSAVLAAKIDIIRGNYDTALNTLSSVLATNPDISIKVPALLHMGIVLENRGSEQDLANAASSYQELLEILEDNPAVEAEALFGLSRTYFAQRNYTESEDALNRALEFSADTTAFEAFQIARLVEAGNQ